MNKYYFYILWNEKDDRYYTGSTNNLKRRLKEHRSGKTRTTRILKTDKLVYFEEYDSETEARLREKKIKLYKSKNYIRWLVNT